MPKYTVQTTINSSFTTEYQETVLSLVEEGDLPNPHHHEHGAFLNYRPWEYSQVVGHARFNNKDKVLDTGAMHTYLALYLDKIIGDLTSTDSFYWAERSYMQQYDMNSPEEWMEYIHSKTNNTVCEHADLMGLPYADNTFDKLISISTIEHVLDDNKALQEMYRVLKPGGKLLLTTEFNLTTSKPYKEDDGTYYRVYDQQGLESLIEQSGFTLPDEIILERGGVEPGKFCNAFICLIK